jgi:hypothetical protein
MSKVQDLRLDAIRLRRLWDHFISTKALPNFGQVPSGTFLENLLFGQGILRQVLDSDEEPLDNGIFAGGMIRWNHSGAQTFHLTRECVESFLLTEVTSLRWKDLVFPFDSFLLLLPDPNPLIFIGDDGRELQVEEVWVSKNYHTTLEGPELHRVIGEVNKALHSRAGLETLRELEKEFHYAPHWTLRATNEEAYCLVRDFQIPADLDTTLNEWIHGDPKKASRWWNEKSKFTMGLVCQVVANLCLWLDGSDLHTGLPHWKRPQESHRGPRKGPQKAQTYVVGRDIQVTGPLRNAAEALGRAEKSEEARATWKLMDQHLVRGHWKMQPYGSGLQSRRRIQIAPYWRGEESSPVRLRTYTVGKSEAGNS